MNCALITDNWLFQDVGECLSHGLDEDEASEIVIDRDRDNHAVFGVPKAGVQLEGLIGLLVDIVLRDSILVDSEFIDTWQQYEENFSVLLRSGLLRALPFRERESDLDVARRFALERLCITSTLYQAQKRNEESWANDNRADDPYMSAVIWGTAGMLGRSHIFEAAYAGHPLRKKVIEQTILSSPSRDIVSETGEWLDFERLRLYESSVKAGTQKAAIVSLPPIAIEVIEEARDAHELIPVAFQLRDKYARLREWLKTIQIAVEAEEAGAVAKYKKTLAAVSKDLDRQIGTDYLGLATLTLGFNWPSISIPLNVLGSVGKRIGIRAILNKQVFAPQGDKGLKKLLGMFDANGTSLGFAAEEYLAKSKDP